MRLAVFSDIHSNDVALSACIDSIEKNRIEGIVLLGDYISDCPNPQRTLNLLKELERRYKTWYIKGNREQYFIDHDMGADDGWGYTSYKGSLLYTYENLTKEDIKRLQEFHDYQILKIPDTEPIMMLHGSPTSLRELMYEGDDNTKQHMQRADVNYMLCGHTHEQFKYCYGSKTLINPGSIGVAIGVSKAAHYAVIEWKDGEWRYEPKVVPFDFQKLYEQFMKSELMEKGGVWPQCILYSIVTGVNYGPLCANSAYDMAKKDGVDTKREGVPEQYWVRAAEKLGVLERILSY